MIFKIVGYNTLNGIKLRKLILKIASEIDEQVTINLVIDDGANLPKLYINDILFATGRVPAEREIKKYLKK